METEYEIDAALRGVDMCRKIVSQPSLGDYVAEELPPGKHIQARDDLVADIRERGCIILKIGCRYPQLIPPNACFLGVSGVQLCSG